MPTPRLELAHISLSFGGLRAVSDVSICLSPGDIQGLIGPNGAGKTTIFNLITGVYVPDGGDIHLGDRRLNGLKPHWIAHAGVARTFQNIRLFGELSVLDNVRVGGHVRAGHTMLAAMLRTPGHRREEAAIDDRAWSMLRLFDLGDRAHALARNLSYGDQRRLEIARALATQPQLLLLDEPAAGMNTTEKAALADLVRQIRQQFDLTILLIEHDMNVVMGLCQQITVLDHGQVIACGCPSEVQNDPKVIEAYLGEPVKK